MGASPSPSGLHRSAYFLLAVLMLASPFRVVAQDATVTESLQTFRTYPFSDPDPIARMGNIYPYFRFHGYSMAPVDRQWKIVTLENRWIRVLIAPEIGGKILGAIEKTTGRAFIYYNRVIKFREIAMRGPWTSGGIEFNFGDIGHTPTTATPVDYLTRTNADGSVSCIVGALDLPSRTEWRVEIRLPGDRAVFETRSFWYNPTPVTTSYYHWMNAAADADSTLRMIYPGTAFIGHAGEVGEWPIDGQGRDLTYYRNNAFGSYKSYHVLGFYTDYFGAQWKDFGVIHWSPYTDKPGKKLWIWGLSREGEIWKSLLTDSALGNTQYVELQSGLHFNQAMMQSSRTPFKHMAFLPHASTQFAESWFPFRGIGSVTKASPDGVLEVDRSGGVLRVGFCPTRAFAGKITIAAGDRRAFERAVDLQPLQAFRDSIADLPAGTAIHIRAGDVIRYSSEDGQRQNLERPLMETESFDWKSPYGLAVDAQERVRQRDAEGALDSYRAALKADPAYLPALAGAAELLIRKLDFDSAVAYARRGLAIDAYDPETNYLYGIAQRYRGRPFDARDGFGIAARSVAYRTAALMQLAEMAFLDGQWADATGFALRAAESNADHIPSLQMLAVLARRGGDSSVASGYLGRISALDPLNHFVRFENFRLASTEQNKHAFLEMIRNELPHESFLELASWYVRAGMFEDARLVLSLSPRQPMIDLWQAYVSAKIGREDESRHCLEHGLSASPALVFPHRREDREVLLWAAGCAGSWKTGYYLALLSWSLGRMGDAAKYFAACGDAPDFAPFYLTRGSFPSRDRQFVLADDRRALAIGPDQWRTYNALVGFHNARGDYAAALEVTRNAAERFPQSYVMKFLLARTLSFNGQYYRSLAILDTLSILPFEGARFGRDAYRQACVMSALDTLRSGHPDAALALVVKARQWPERLGAGKPYDVDTRIEGYLEYRIRKQRGDASGSARSMDAVTSYSVSHADQNGAQHVIGALALRDAGKMLAATDLLQRWMKREPSNELAKWGMAILGGHLSEARKIAERLQGTALNRATGDQEAVLVADVVMGWN
jgi:tetratricopeptide (TPR) repeat protein